MPMQGLYGKETSGGRGIMAMAVKIGKIVDFDCENELYKQVEQCPNADTNICNSENTVFPKSALRMFSVDSWESWESSSNELHTLYESMREYPDLDGPEVIRLKPFIKDINKLPDDHPEDDHVDRMKWFKYWSNKAVELYGECAGIQFS